MGHHTDEGGNRDDAPGGNGYLSPGTTSQYEIAAIADGEAGTDPDGYTRAAHHSFFNHKDGSTLSNLKNDTGDAILDLLAPLGGATL